MRGHDCRESRGDCFPVWRNVFFHDFCHGAPIARHLDVGIERRKAVTWKVLADRRHARGRESLHDAGAERADRVGVEVQRTVADGLAGAVIQVEHRREAEIDAVRGKLRGDDVGGAARRLARRAALAVPPPTELAHRGDRGEAVAKPLYAPAFVVDADRQRRLAQALDVLGERA